MTASDYGVTFPYGATSAPYSSAHPHRGDDRPCPEGTVLQIAGVNIGLTGNTGFVTGPHLHIQEWQGNPANVRKPQNAFVPGTVTAATSSSDFGNYVTITTADGWNDSYCHLSQINVTVGQVIGEEMTVTSSDQARQDYLLFGIEVAGDSPALLNAVGADELEFIKGMGPQVQNNMKAKDDEISGLRTQISALQSQADSGFTPADRATLNWIQKAIASVFRIN